MTPPDESFGVLSEPATLTIRRLLPGPIDRVWAYLTDSDLRRKWLAAGEMDLAVDAPFTLTWRNDELSDPPGARPEGFGEEHAMECRILALEPPNSLTFTWGQSSEVSFLLAPKGAEVELTVVHRRLPDRGTVLMVGPGWHGHLDILVARLNDREPAPFWDSWRSLKEEYERRFAA